MLIPFVFVNFPLTVVNAQYMFQLAAKKLFFPSWPHTLRDWHRVRSWGGLPQSLLLKQPPPPLVEKINLTLVLELLCSLHFMNHQLKNNSNSK